MKVIGLTGGISSGKSTAAAILKEFGAVIIDADKLAREVVGAEKSAWREIKNWLGEGFLAADNSLDRKKIAAKIFSDSDARKKLESITHPYILAEVKRLTEQAAAEGRCAAVLDVPLLFESAWQDLADEVWVVYVKREIQLKRLMARDNISLDEAAARLEAQMSLEAKARLADVVIDNGQDIECMREEIKKAWDYSISKNG